MGHLAPGKAQEKGVCDAKLSDYFSGSESPGSWAPTAFTPAKEFSVRQIQVFLVLLCFIFRWEVLAAVTATEETNLCSVFVGVQVIDDFGSTIARNDPYVSPRSISQFQSHFTSLATWLFRVLLQPHQGPVGIALGRASRWHSEERGSTRKSQELRTELRWRLRNGSRHVSPSVGEPA